MTIELIHQLFEDQVNQNPQNVAVVMGNAAIEYRSLNQHANQIAHLLIRKGVAPDQLVGISMHRSLDMIAALLGILKAGSAYLPIDPDYPVSHLQRIVEDAKPEIILTDGTFPSINVSDTSFLNLKSLKNELKHESDVNPDLRITKSNLAYCIYTSGSTGRPKGVLVEHYSVVNFIKAAVIDYGITPIDRMLQFASLNFDTSVEEIFPSLSSSAVLVLRQPDMTGSIQRFLQECDRQEITILDLPTAFWHELVLHLEKTCEALPKSLRLIIIGGERVNPDVLQRWHALDLHSVRLDNTYGLTECTCVSTRCILTPEERRTYGGREVTIGKAVQNVKFYVLDKNLTKVSENEPGELYIGGDCLARGYLNLPEITRERFLKDPFASGNEKIYRTGDLVLKRPDGNLEYLGRNDEQIKIRGFRIEPGEIESSLLELKEVKQAFILKRTDKVGNDHLIAYLVLQPGEKIAHQEIWRHLAKNLPTHYIPAFFVFLKNFPLLPNNKINKTSLPDPKWDTEDLTAAAAPTNDTENMLLAIWEEAIGRKGIGIDDDFFELGGNSILAARMATMVEAKIFNPIPMAVLVEVPTIRGLAKLLVERGWNPGWQSLVPMRKGGKNPPLFLLHAMWGDILSYRRLVNHFRDNDRPVFGVRARGFDGKDPPITNLKKMAAYYINEVKKTQRKGPYFLAGYSFGGTIAYEMAQQLVAAGEQVAMLAMFDTVIMDSVVPEWMPTKIEILGNEITRYFLGATRWLRISLEKKGEFLNYVRNLIRDWLRARFSGKRFIAPGDQEGLERIAAMPEAHRNVHAANVAALRSYSAVPYPGKVTLFNARDRVWSDLINPLQFWKKMAKGGVISIICAGKHYSFLDEPHVSDLAEKLEAVLQELQSE